MVLLANIPDNKIISEFQPIRPGAADLELKMHVQLTYFFFFRQTEKKIKFVGIQEFFLGFNFTTA